MSSSPCTARRTLRTAALGLLGAATTVSVGLPALTPPATADHTVTAAVDAADRSARTVSHKDVDGDGDRDVVRYRGLDGDRVRISVRTGDGCPARTVLDTAYWPGPGGEWLGAAPLDGNRGAELVVGTATGAHAMLWTVLTMRGDTLRVQRNPAAPRAVTWLTDAAANFFEGWTRTTHHGEIFVVHRAVQRQGTSNRWRGEWRRFRWDQGWDRAGQHDIRIRGDRKAARIGGWHVPGLPVWPS